ncbi:hypothetical protein QZH41_020674, partial [Actinostola sp. cb2023]
MANYPSNLDCTYDIITPIGTGIKLTWSSFDINGGSSGNSYSSAHTTIKNSICGYKTPFTFTTSKDAVFVRFKTGNKNNRRRGFIAGYVLYKP